LEVVWIEAVCNISIHYLPRVTEEVGTAVAQWLRYCATNQKVAGSIPDGVNGIFH
jgi:predicted Zn-dependent protease